MSSETGKRNPDRMNMMGVVLAGVCGSVLVYVSIVLLQAFYMNDTAQVDTMADYGGQDSMHRSIKSQQIGNIDPAQGVRNTAKDTFTIKIDRAIELIVEDARRDPKDPDYAKWVPSEGRSDKSNVEPIYGRPITKKGAAATPAPAPGSGSGSATDPGVIAPGPGGAAPIAPTAPTAPPAGAGSGAGSAGVNVP
jgi:hypothetical protein